MATLALVTSVAGNAAAAVIISSNHQVAAGTIAGANAPAGDKKNLIAGSVGSADLHNASVTAGKLAPDARAHKINFIRTGLGNNNATLLKLDELTIAGGCEALTPDAASPAKARPLDEPFVAFDPLTVTSSVSGDLNWSYIQDNQGAVSDHAGGTALAANSPTHPFGSPVALSDGAGNRLEGQLIYANSERVVTVTFHLVAEQDVNYLCEMTGTAVVAAKR